MNNPVEKINNIKDKDDFLNFVVELARDANEHPEEWTNTTLTDFLGQLASWVDDMSQFDKETDCDNVGYFEFVEGDYNEKVYSLRV